MFILLYKCNSNVLMMAQNSQSIIFTPSSFDLSTVGENQLCYPIFIYSRFNFTELEVERVFSSHYKPVHDVCFPSGCSELVATCSENDIRVWHAGSSRELLRITEPNMICNAIAFTPVSVYTTIFLNITYRFFLHCAVVVASKRSPIICKQVN